MKPLLIILVFWALHAQGQIPDLDEFSDDLDLELPGQQETSTTSRSSLPQNHLFAGWEEIKDLVEWDKMLRKGKILHFELPGGAYLVAPNVPSIPLAYVRTATTVGTDDVKSGNLLKVVLHADGNFSTALFLAEPPTQPIPPGLDISPVEKKHLVGMVSDIQRLDRSSPQVLNTFVRLQQEAKKKGWKLDRREFIFLPIEPGRVFFGLELIVPAKDDKSANRE